jgi:hypothetical protein
LNRRERFCRALRIHSAIWSIGCPSWIRTTIARVRAGRPAVERTIETTFDTLLPIISLKLPLQQAIAKSLAAVEGSKRIARMLPRFFDRSDRLG